MSQITSDSDPYSFFSTTNQDALIQTSNYFTEGDDRTQIISSSSQQSELEQHDTEQQNATTATQGTLAQDENTSNTSANQAHHQEQDLLRLMQGPIHWKHIALIQARRAKAARRARRQEGEISDSDTDSIFGDGTKKNKRRRKNNVDDQDHELNEDGKKGKKKKVNGPIDFSAPIIKKYLSNTTRKAISSTTEETVVKVEENEALLQEGKSKRKRKNQHVLKDETAVRPEKTPDLEVLSVP